MRKAILLSKRTLARSGYSDAPPRPHVLRRTRANKKGAYYQNPIFFIEYIHLQMTIDVIKFKHCIYNAQHINQTMRQSNKGLIQSFYPAMPSMYLLYINNHGLGYN
ncbi:hypothetical protein Bca4012_005143 [Brassica carinata]